MKRQQGLQQSNIGTPIHEVVAELSHQNKHANFSIKIFVFLYYEIFIVFGTKQTLEKGKIKGLTVDGWMDG